MSWWEPSFFLLLSLPVWEEWIEIRDRIIKLSSCASLPVWEEWIEI